MATYSKASRNVPSLQRIVKITNVVAGDEIDVRDALGRPARHLKIIPDDASDSIDIRLNNKVKYEVTRDNPTEGGHTVEFVSEGSHFPVLNYTGSAEYVTDDIHITYVQVDAITFGAAGTDIQLVVW